MKSLNKTAVTGLICFLLISLLLGLYITTAPLIINDTQGDSTVHIEARHERIFFLGECLHVQWEMTGINAVFIQRNDKERGTKGTDASVFCIISENPSLRVDFPDGSSKSYSLEIIRLYESPLYIVAYLALLLLACIFVYRLFGAAAVLVLLTIVLMSPIINLNLTIENDMRAHMSWAEDLTRPDNTRPILPHFLFHISTIGLTKLIPSLSFIRASYFVLMASQIITVLGLYALLLSFTPQEHRSQPLKLLYAALALALLFIGPLSYFMNGFSLIRTSPFIYPNTYHSPTMYVLRPAALWLFIALLKMPKVWSRQMLWHLLAIVLLNLLSSFAKPNYTLVIVPAYLLIVVIEAIRERRLNPYRNLVALCLVISSVLVISWQYFTFFGADSSGGIGIQWLGSYGVWGYQLRGVLLSSLASLLFPLAVSLLYLRASLADSRLNLAWISFGGAWLMAFLFIEYRAPSHGNLVWGGQITALILFATSTAFLFQQSLPLSKATRDWRFYLCGLLFLLHLFNHSLALFYFITG